jgi:fimbrial chaperone protein
MSTFNRRRLLFAGAAGAALAVLGSPAQALLVQPILIQLSAAGQGSNAQLRVVNDRNRAVTVEVSVNRLIVPPTGPINQEADDGEEFLIFPPQATIQPGATQVFRIRWIGDPDIAEAKLYMFSSSELPVDMEPGVTGIQMLYSIQSVVTVSPVNGKAELATASIERATGPAGETGLNITFSNSGNDVALLSRAGVEIQGDGWSRALTSTQVAERVGIGVVPPNGSRQLFFPLEDLPADGAFTARVSLAPGG